MAEGMLSLSWNNHSSTFTHTLASLREKERYTDVTLSCDGRFYPVHKLVLSTCSEYFMRMFELTPCKHPVVVLQDVHCKEMEALLSYMYLGVVSVAQSDLPQLIKVAEALQIKGLAVPDENLCSNMKFGPTWSPTDDRNSPFLKKMKREENGTQTHRILEPRPGISPQSVTRYGPQGFVSIGSSFSSAVNPHRYSPYNREGEVHSATRGNKKDNIIVPRVTPKLEQKEKYNKCNSKTQRMDKGTYRMDRGSGRMDDPKTEKMTDQPLDENHDRCLDTDDDNSSEMQEVLPVSLVKVEVKEEDDDDEHIDVDDTGPNIELEASQPLPLLVPKREPIDDHRNVTSGHERVGL